MAKNYIELSGLNIEKAIKKLNKLGVKITDLSRESERAVRLWAHCKGQKLIDLFEHSCYNLKIIKSVERAALLMFLSRRFGLLLAAAVFVFCTAFYTSRVRYITVDGDGAVSASEVVAELYRLGIKPGTNKSGVNERGIESALMSAFKSAALVSVKLHGVSLNVSIAARSGATPETPVPGNIVSVCEGVVTGIIVLGGTAKVKPGDTVTLGQVLIEAKIYAPDGSFEETEAKGEVYGIFGFVYMQEFKEDVLTPYRTGNSASISYYRLLGLTFPASPKLESGFKSYEEEVKRRYAFENTPLTAEKVTVTHYEIGFALEKRDFEKERKYILEEAENAARKAAELSGEIISVETEVSDGSGGKIIAVKMQVKALFSARIKAED